MAQLKDSLITGSLRVTDTIFSTNLNLSSLTASYAVLTDANKNLVSRGITNNTSATAVTASTNLITANTLYYHKGNSNIVTVGTISSGTWQGTTIGTAYGGTGNTSFTQWGVIYANPATKLVSTAAGTSGYLLQGNGAAAPSWIQATNSNTASTIVKRDASGNFSAGTITAALSGNATTCTYPLGFASRTENATWGNTTGTTVTSWNDADGGSIDFRKNNPSSGKISIKVDGRFYGNEGSNPAMLMNSDGSYWGMGDPDGNSGVWIRTTSAGIIPSESGGATAGHCSIGTSSWYFGSLYVQNAFVNALEMSGNISFTNSGTGFRGINYGTMGDNDQWRIGGAATGSNAGYMEIATADDGTEPIYVRQYTGVFSSLTRTLTLLDGSGNTIMPGNLTVGGVDNRSTYLTIMGDWSNNSYLWLSEGSNSTVYGGYFAYGASDLVHIGTRNNGGDVDAIRIGRGSSDVTIVGQCTATQFNGPLNGNAATATNADTVDGYHNYNLGYRQSSRDFGSGTFVETDISYPEYGDAFYLKIEGNSYGSIFPFTLSYQGYIYYDTVINNGGISLGTNLSGAKILKYNNHLCFWWPRQAYWQGFSVFCAAVTGAAECMKNRVISITDSAQPTTDHAQDISFKQVIFSGDSPTFQEVYVNGWVRFPNWTGLYSPNNGAHFYPNNGSTYGAWCMAGSKNGYYGLCLGNSDTYLHVVCDSSGNGGFLAAGATWPLYYYRSGGRMALMGSDTGSGYSVQVNGSLYVTSTTYIPGTIYSDSYCYFGSVWANRGSPGERQVGVDYGTAGNLYLWSNSGEKGLYSASGYSTGYVVRLTNGHKIHYGGSTAGGVGADETGIVLKCPAISSNTGIYNGNGDSYGYGTANLIIKSWWGVGFVDGCTGNGMTAGVDCRTGDIHCKGSLYVSKGNTTGGGIVLADDGDIVDLNDGYCAMRFTYGVRIYSGNRGGSGVTTLYNDGQIHAGSTVVAPWFSSETNILVKFHASNEITFHTGSNSMWFNYRTSNAQITTFYFGNGTTGGLGTVNAGAVYGAVWNDYAEYREGTTTEPGRVVATTQFSNKVSPTTERLQPAAHVISDTAGYTTGKSDTAQSPLGVAGRVLVFPYRDISEYKVGDVLCAAPGGTADIMTRDEIMLYPDRIIGIVDEIPTYEYWHQTLSCAKEEDKNKGTKGATVAHVKINGRIWMYIK